MAALYSHVAERVDLGLNRLLKTNAELECAVLGWITVLRAIADLGLEEDRVPRLQVIQGYLDHGNLGVILLIFVTNRQPEKAGHIAHFLRIV